MARKPQASKAAVAKGEYEHFRRLMNATTLLSDGGSHTDVLNLEPRALRDALLQSPGARRFTPTQQKELEAVAAELSERYLVKKGKITWFAQPLLGEEPNRVRRSVVSYGFGSLGFSVMPTLEKAIADATEAARLVPYLGYGPMDGFLAPDIVAETGSAELLDPRGARILRTVLDGAPVERSLFDLFAADPFLPGGIEDAACLADRQERARTEPLTPAMEKTLASFFEDPITVGVRDTIRWLNGARHPSMPWERAKRIIHEAFGRYGDENFLLPEMSWYSYDTALSAEEIQKRQGENAPAVELFSKRIRGALPEALLASYEAADQTQIAAELLDFHYDYRLYEVEPYTGLVSMTMLRLVARFATGLLVEAMGLPVPGQGNTEIAHLPLFHHETGRWLASLDEDLRERAVEVLGDLLVKLRRRGLKDRSGERLAFQSIPRTVYTLQQRADVPLKPGGDVVGCWTMHELWKPENADLWDAHPELADKLVVFFTLIYRYFEETGYIADLRPRDSGRDIFVMGIWGYVTENLLIVQEVWDEGGVEESEVRVAFVDNRDQFKEYRGDSDRRNPLGVAKYGLRLVYPIIDPALQRSIGLFVEKIREREDGLRDDMPKDAFEAADKSVDLVHAIAKSAVDQTFTNTRSFLDDVIDDVYTAASRLISTSRRAFRRLRR